MTPPPEGIAAVRVSVATNSRFLSSKNRTKTSGKAIPTVVTKEKGLLLTDLYLLLDIARVSASTSAGWMVGTVTSTKLSVKVAPETKVSVKVAFPSTLWSLSGNVPLLVKGVGKSVLLAKTLKSAVMIEAS